MNVRPDSEEKKKMRMSLLTRAAAVTAITATTALAVTSTVSAAPNPVKPVLPAKPDTSLSIRVSKGVVKPGDTVRIAGVLKGEKSGIAGKTVRLDVAAIGGKFVVVGRSATNKAGGVAFVVTPKVTERYKLVFKGAKRLAPAHSAVVTIRVSFKMA
jgi:hypothetical protein